MKIIKITLAKEGHLGGVRYRITRIQGAITVGPYDREQYRVHEFVTEETAKRLASIKAYDVTVI